MIIALRRTTLTEARGRSSQPEDNMMRRAVSEYGLMATASVTASASANEPKISRNNIQVEHIAALRKTLADGEPAQDM